MHFSTAIVAAILSYTVSAIPTNSYSTSYSSGSFESCKDSECNSGSYGGKGSFLIPQEIARQSTRYNDKFYCFAPDWNPSKYGYSYGKRGSGSDHAGYISISYIFGRYCCAEGYVPSFPTSSYDKRYDQPSKTVQFFSESAEVQAEKIVKNGGDKQVDKFDAQFEAEELETSRNGGSRGYPYARRWDRKNRQDGDDNDSYDSGKSMSSSNNHYNDYIDFQFFAEEKEVESGSVTARFDGSRQSFDSKTTLIKATSLSATEIIGHNRCYVEEESKVVEQFEVTESGWSKTVDFHLFAKETLSIHCEWIN